MNMPALKTPARWEVWGEVHLRESVRFGFWWTREKEAMGFRDAGRARVQN